MVFFALLSTIIASFADVFWKKSLIHKIRPRAHELACYPVAFFISAYFYISGFSLSDVYISAFAVVGLIIIIDAIRQPVMQGVYKEEKLSVIVPYLNLSKIFIIVSSFFIFQDVSYTSFFIALFTVWVIILWSIDIHTFRLPRNFLKILFVETCRATWALLWGWIIVNHWDIVFFNIYVLGAWLFTLFLTITTKQYKDFKNLPKAFWTHREMAALWWFSWFLSLVVIKNLGLSLWILLGFLWIWVTLFFSYIFLWDKPSKKNIILTIIVSLLIWIGYYFK